VIPAVIGTIFLVAYYVVRWWGPIAVANRADIREDLFGAEMDLLFFFALAAFGVFAVRLAELVVFDLFLGRKNKLEAPLLLRQIFTIVLYGFFFSFLILHVFDFEVIGFLAPASVVGIVLGLALQDTLGNLFAGLALHVEHSFDVGDVVKSGEFFGIVERVNWRAAWLRTVNNDLVVVPNSLIARERLEVFPRDTPVGRIVTIRVGFDQYPEQVIAAIERAVKNVPGVTPEIPPSGRLSAFTDSAIVYEVKYWTRKFHQREQIDADVRRAMWYALHREGMSSPLPMRVVRFTRESPTPRPEPVDVVGHLEGIDLFSVLNDEERQTLASRIEVKYYGKGETIIQAGEEGDSMFIVDRGRVSVRLGGSRNPTETIELGDGSVFGEMALLTGEKRIADVVSLTDVIAFEIDRDSLLPILGENRELANGLSERIVRRRQEKVTMKTSEAEDDEHSLGQRIRAWFGL
jgi:small-conductance mechanosensitive channel/CRP-like cAMP-binding protein